jgi:hypothetical protein
MKSSEAKRSITSEVRPMATISPVRVAASVRSRIQRVFVLSGQAYLPDLFSKFARKSRLRRGVARTGEDKDGRAQNCAAESAKAGIDAW